MANLTIYVNLLPNESIPETQLPDEMNITKLTRLYPSRFDNAMHSPSSILIMLLIFIALLLALVIFCLLTNPVPRQEKKEHKDTLNTSRTEKKEEKDLKIDYSHLKIVDDLDSHSSKNVGKNELTKKMESITFKSTQSDKHDKKETLKTLALKSATKMESKSKALKDTAEKSIRSGLNLGVKSKMSTADSSVMSKNAKSSFSVKSLTSLGAVTTSVTQ